MLEYEIFDNDDFEFEINEELFLNHDEHRDEYFEDDFSSEELPFARPKNKIERGSFIPSHLSMPITNDDTNFILKYNEFFCPRHKIIKNIVNNLKITHDIYNLEGYDPYLLLLNFIQDSSSLKFSDLRKSLTEHLDLAVNSLFVHKVNFLGKACSGKHKEKISESCNLLLNQLISRVPEILADYEMMKKVEIIKDKICAQRIKFGDFIEFNSNLKIERDIFLLKYKEDGWTIGPTNLFLCVLDIYQSRFPKKLYWLLSDLSKKYPTSLFSTGNKLIVEFEKLRKVLKNDFFKFIATWESLVLGFVIKEDEEDLGFSELYQTSYTGMKEILDLYNVDYRIEDLLPQDRNIDNIKMFIELLGNTKHFGHPCLEIKSGFDNVRKYGTEQVTIDISTAKIGASIMRRDFVKNFILKKRRWPPCLSIPELLTKSYKNGTYPIKHEKRYDLWAEVKFGKVFDYDLSPDTTELIKDSAAADDFPDWYSDYDSCAFQHLHGKRKPPLNPDRKPTRVIQRFLQGNEFDVEKKIHELKNNYFDPKDSTACLCRKEQELKPDGRLFVKQPFNQRLGQTSMESNIAKQYMKYVPEQTMTDGEIKLMRRLAETAKGQKRSTLEIFNLDLSKWNMRFRHALVYWFGVVLDELFDSGDLYKNNHLWFLLAKVFCNSRLAPPDYDEDLNPIPGEFFYDDQLGGMEGMRQKLWTIITICLIKYSAESENLPINIMCQGDNQVVMVNYPTLDKEERKKKRFQLLERLERNFKAVNLILKREETWFSIRLCEFGKVRYFDGEAISNGDKKINRCIPDINDGVCSIMSSLSTINTITEATAKCDYMPDTSFVINQFSIVNYLDRKNIFKVCKNKFEKMAYLYHPTDFGGISLSTYFSHTIRGYDDKLTLWISLLKTLKELFPHVYFVTEKLNIGEPKRGPINHSKLVEDIFSLNIVNLPSVERKMKNLALAYLKSPNVTNPEVTNIFNSSAIKTKEEIVTRLVTMKPFIPSLAHELLRNSNTGILLALRNQFSNLSTINKLVQELSPNLLKKMTYDISYIEDEEDKDRPFDFLKIAEINNQKCIDILVKRLSRKQNKFLDSYINYECPTEASSNLRKEHWKLEIIGSSKPFPPCQFKIKDLDSCDKQELETSILISLSEEFSSVQSVNYLRDGPYLAYLGSATQEKVKKPTLDIAAKTSFTKSLQQLHLIKSWCQRLNSKNLEKLVNELINEKQDLIPEELEDFEIEDWCAMVWGGNLLHRFRSLIEKDAAVINFLSTQATHMVQSTNKLASITSGGRDFTIHFQMILIYNMITISLLKEVDYLDVSQFCSILCCSGCTKEVTTLEVDLEDSNDNTYSDQKDDNILLKQKIFLKESSYTTDELILAVSTHLGRAFGSSTDALFLKTYIIDKIANNVKITSEVNQISVNDLRHVDIDLFIIALISKSKIVKRMLLYHNPIKLFYQRATFFQSLCTFLMNGGLLEKFIYHLDLNITEHGQALDPVLMSSVIMSGLYKWTIANYQKYFPYLLVKLFKGDEDFFVFDNQKWVRAFARTHRLISHDEHKETSLNLDSLSLNQTQLTNLLQLSQPQTLNRRMDQEKAIYHLRALISSNKLTQPPLHKINNLNYYCSSVKSKTYLSYINNYYSEITTLLPADENYKDLHQTARPNGVISTAINKIEEILIILNIGESDPKNIYCLAEGSGSIIEGLGVIFKNSMLFYNSLLIPSIDFRQGADQDYPPSVICSKKICISRINTDCNLSKGETNILKDGFLKKLELAFCNYPPDIITMDAETNKFSDNKDIFTLHIPLLVKYRVKYLFYKMFLNSEEIPNFINLESNFPQYYFYLFKPISSNTNNSEFYMVGCLKSLITPSLNNDLKSLSIKMLEVLNRKLLSSRDAYDCYLKYARVRNEILSRTFSGMSSTIDVSLFEYNKLAYCSIYCKHHIFHLLTLIQELNDFDKNDASLYPIIRNGGIISNVNRSFFLLVSLLSITTLNNVAEAIYLLTTKKITGFTRKNIYIEGGIVADNLKDWKWLIKMTMISQKGIINTCHCRSNRYELIGMKKLKGHEMKNRVEQWVRIITERELDINSLFPGTILNEDREEEEEEDL